MTKEQALEKIKELEKYIKEFKEKASNDLLKEKTISGMLYRFWDDNKDDYVLGELESIYYDTSFTYLQKSKIGSPKWKHAEPAWDLVWTLLDHPYWAEYCAMDKGGEWYWYKNYPVLSHNEWLTHGKHYCKFSFKKHPNWKESKMKRPEGV